MAPPRPKLVPRATDPDKALAGLERKVRDAQETNRNKMLCWAACGLRERVDAGELDNGIARHALRDAALAAGLEDSEIAATLRSALQPGTVAA